LRQLLGSLDRQAAFDATAIRLHDGRFYAPHMPIQPLPDETAPPGTLLVVTAAGGSLRLEAGNRWQAQGVAQLQVRFRPLDSAQTIPLLNAVVAAEPAAVIPYFWIDLAAVAGRTGWLEVSSMGAPLHITRLSLNRR
jgi:hypothetical protein